MKSDELMRRLTAFNERAIALLLKNIKTAFMILGEECVTKIRDRSQRESWIDHTGNLRSSIGDAVYDHGKIVTRSLFSTVSGPVGTGSDGSLVGKKMIEDLAKEYTDACALVVIAGMDYAGYVEAIEGKDVLESVKIWAEGVVRQRLQNALDAAICEINKWEL